MQERPESVRFDWQPVLAEIQTQTLVLHGRDDHVAAFHNGEHCAQQIPSARFIPLEGDIHFPWLGDWQSVLTPVLEFLLGDDSGGCGRLLSRRVTIERDVTASLADLREAHAVLSNRRR